MATRVFVARIAELNSYMSFFPPGFNEGQRLGEEDLKDILIRGIPKPWKVQMGLQGFKARRHSSQEIVEFCERFEKAEEQLGGNLNRFQKQGKPSGGKADPKDGEDALLRAKSPKGGKYKKEKSVNFL